MRKILGLLITFVILVVLSFVLWGVKVFDVLYVGLGWIKSVLQTVEEFLNGFGGFLK
ncbi:MAG: hypothetical protein LBT30_07530 [Clostridiales bacterium]|jgi:hypothetical protein|nr:hypothetical protein [Clostridiales bacterium]